MDVQYSETAKVKSYWQGSQQLKVLQYEYTGSPGLELETWK